MKRMIFINILVACISIGKAEHRFFPANSIHCVNVVWGEKDLRKYDPIHNEYGRIPIYYHYYTGNDTIVDDKPCVMLWKYCADTPEDKELRFLCEEDGFISYKYPLAEGGYSDWLQLFEFPEGGWVEGEYYADGYFNGQPSESPGYFSYITLLNGEEIQLNCSILMYGLGYKDWPFFEYRDFSEGPSKKLQPYSFYRNDTLLWGKPATYGPFFPAHSIRCANMVTSLYSNDTTYCNLYTGGDTLVDGKECVQLWQYCTDTPDELKLSLLHEVDDKVYIRYSDDGEWNLLYDFSLPNWRVGDSIEDTEFGYMPIESIDTITLLNGDTRQVAYCQGGGNLIHGIGYVGETFFSPVCRSHPEDGTVWYPVSFYYWNELLLGEELPKKREDRFFPANGVYTSSRHIIHSHNSEDLTIEYDTTYTSRWTGNDTIVDGRECVVLWEESSGSIKRLGVIYESLNGVVYLNTLADDKSDWTPLYDFTPRHWKEGDITFVNTVGYALYSYVSEVSSITLLNGENVPYIALGPDSLVYGLGYYDSFLEPVDVAYSTALSFYRNGELLWGKEEKLGTSVAAPMVNQTPTPYYDLMGRPVAYPTRGIYIKDGKKIAVD